MKSDQAILITKARDIGETAYRATCGNCTRSFIVYKPYDKIVCPSCMKELKAVEVEL